ncbi:MAG: hypothetical protein ACQEQ7_02245 [Thermodesulfobacteriota bacterium]
MSRSGRKHQRPDGYQADRVLSTWMGKDSSNRAEENAGSSKEAEFRNFSDNQPVEPDRGGPKGPGILKWIFFILVVVYTLFSYFHAPILSRIGEFLVVEDPIKKADVIVCTPGYPVEQFLTAAEFYNRGFSPRIFLPDPSPPAGFEVLKERGGVYPSITDLSMVALESLGVPESAIISTEGSGRTLTQTARAVKTVVKQEGYHALIIVSPPWRARLTRAVFREALRDGKVELMMAPSHYSNFRENEWWKSDAYLSTVFFQYEKLLWHTLKNLW